MKEGEFCGQPTEIFFFQSSQTREVKDEITPVTRWRKNRKK
jgi:hypothetical protein